MSGSKKKNIHKRLKRLHQPRVRQQQAKRSEEVYEAPAVETSSYSLDDVYDTYLESKHDVWFDHGAIYEHYDGGSALCFETTYPSSHPVGHKQLQQGRQLDFTFGLDDPPKGISLETCCFLDLETSGLRYQDVAFCVGLGRWQAGQFHVKQYILPNEEEEYTQLQGALDWFEGMKMLVTFNGKSFDVPRLIARLKKHQLPHEVLEEMFHIDLMLVLRQKRQGKSGYGLQDIEAQLLSLRRQHDVPGHQAPRLWQSYCRTGQLGQLVDIFEHNRQDIVSLAALMGEAYPQTIRERKPTMVQKKLARTYQLRANQSKKQHTPYDSKTTQTPQTPQTSHGDRLQHLRIQVEGALAQGFGPATCLSQLAEIVALSPNHAFGLKHLAHAYRELGLVACAQMLEDRLSSALPY